MGLLRKIFKRDSDDVYTGGDVQIGEGGQFNPKEVPYTKGNMWNNEKQLQTRESQINDYVRQTEKTKSVFAQYHYTNWELMQFQADYFVSSVRFTFEDAKIDRMLYGLMRCNFLYGNVGLLFKDEDIYPIVESHAVIDVKTGDLKKVEGYSMYDVLTYEGSIQDMRDKLKSFTTISGDDLKENYLRLTGPTHGFNGIVRWNKFVKQQEKLLKKIFNYASLFNRKVVYHANDPKTAIQELMRFYDEDHPFIINANTIDPNSNKFDVEGVYGINSQELFDYYDNWIRLNYMMLGRRLNVDRKGERNITKEVESSQDNFAILENEIKIFKTNFLKDVAKRIGKDVILIEEVEKQNRENNQLPDQSPEQQVEENKNDI